MKIFNNLNILNVSSMSKRSSRGQSLIEFALVMVLFFLPLTTLVLDGVRIFTTYNRLQEATREGAKVVTESQAPIPNPNALQPLPPNCEETCSDDFICCIAVKRANAVLWHSGIKDATVTGRWSSANKGDVTYVFLTIAANKTVRYFFQTGSLNLSVLSTGYADEFNDEKNDE